METLPLWKKSLYSALIFFGTLIVLSVGYAAWNAAMSKVNPGNPLSATAWNALVDNIADLDSRWSRSGSDLVFTGGNVGIGTPSPGTKLEVSGNVKISDGTQGMGKILTSDANGSASWSDPSYQFVTMNITPGTVANSSNSTFSTSDVTLTQGVWLLNLGYHLIPNATSGYFDVHIDVSSPTSGTFSDIGTLPSFNSETAYQAGRHGYLSNSRLFRITSPTATVHALLSHAWSDAGASYTIAGATLSMIASKVR